MFSPCLTYRHGTEAGFFSGDYIMTAQGRKKVSFEKYANLRIFWNARNAYFCNV